MSKVPSITIQQAEIRDADALTRIAIAAKRHWNYPEELIQLWEKDLTITTTYLRKNIVLKAVQGDTILGFGALEKNAEGIEVEHLWIMPAHIGRGLGKCIMDQLKIAATALGEPKILIVSDPYAVGFYEKQGGKVVGQEESSPADRFLPVLEIRL